MSKHTPGPWIVDRAAHSPDVLASDGKPVAMMRSQYRTDDETFANARLIAAAPEMYEALKDLRETVTDAYKAGRIPAEPFVRAGNILSKAEGK